MVWPDGNAASVEIRKKRGFPRAAWKSLAKRRRDFPTFPQALLDFFLFQNLKTKNVDNVTFYEKHSKGVEEIDVAHPASNPVLDSFGKQHSNYGREGQDAVEDYSESGAKVQVLCLPKREVGGIGWRAGASYRNSCPRS
jgi:hypothetical protein